MGSGSTSFMILKVSLIGFPFNGRFFIMLQTYHSVLHSPTTLVGMTTHKHSHGRTLVAQGGTFIHGNVVRSLHHVEKQRAERHISNNTGVG